MKKKSLFLSIVLAFVGIFATFGLAGCGDVSLGTLQENYKTLQATYKQYSDVFKTGVCENMSTPYYVDYGEIVNGFVSENRDEYRELLKVYNITLALSNDYVDNNISYILNFDEKELNSKSKECINKFNSTLVNYTSSIKKFVNARNSLITHFENFGGEPDSTENLAFLRKFKKQYGALVEKNINLSMDLTNCIEATELFEILQKGSPTTNDTKIIKEYIRAKLLPIFSKFKISNLENNLYWGAYSSIDTPAKERIDDLIDELSSKFETYKSNFIGDINNFKELTKSEMKRLIEIINDFLVEIDDYYQALNDFKLERFVEKYDIDLTEYKKENELAEIYLQKMEEFIGISFGNFVNCVIDYIY